jgi:D-beta-D-heptose 7-phosphate kinase/D-beta-D-heptose 1-phosphate adenosyltransferase
MNLVERLIELDRASSKRVAVVGDSMVDEWCEGVLSDSQDGCKKFVVEKQNCTPGGAAGAARQLSNWNARARLFSVLSRRFEWPQMRHLLRDVNDSWCRTVGTVPIKQRYLSEGKIVFRCDLDEPKPHRYPEPLVEDFPDVIAKDHYDAILITDYDKGLLSAELVQKLVEIGVKQGIPVVADAKREPGFYQGAILKCNEAYWKRYKHSDVLPTRLVITLGPCEAHVGNPLRFQMGGSFRLNRLPNVSCVNHVGAGDCFAAHLVLALAHGFNLEEAALVAYCAGRVYVQKPFGQPPTPEEVAADFAGGLESTPSLRSVHGK